ncbi:MAG: phosphatidate cytidylyltransferase [Thermoguttaceae bacterium]
MDPLTIGFLGGVLLVLLIVSIVVVVLRKQQESGIDPAVLETFRSRIRAWWLLFGSLVGAFLIGHTATIILFGLIAFWALREYITLTPTRPADHPTLVWVFFLCTPLQFALVGLDPIWFRTVFGVEPYLVYSILIPAYVLLILPALIAMSGDSKGFLERIAKIQVGLLICVYSLSFAPALLTMELSETVGPTVLSQETAGGTIPGGVEEEIVSQLRLEKGINPDGSTVQLQSPRPTLQNGNLRLLFFFVLLVQLSDVCQYLWAQIRFRHVIAPTINSTRTWEGVLGGAATTTLLGISLWWFTPLLWWGAGITAFVVSFMGLAGSMTMSAIKRDRGVEDYGTLIEGHNGVLDRIDSLCFAAPAFYHLVWILTR